MDPEFAKALAAILQRQDAQTRLNLEIVRQLRIANELLFFAIGGGNARIQELGRAIHKP